MKRRQFLVASALAGIGASALGQPNRRRQCAAVVIGVNKAGNLPVLRAAASGARQVEAFLKREGYDVALFIDDEKPVEYKDIYRAIKGFIDKGTFDQLVVYFAGHGFSNQYVEYWLLSNAPQDPNEAVSLRESVQFARLYSSIPNVIFISDACRSTAASLRAQAVRGSVIFPTANSVRPSDVDQFMATLVGDPSYEVPLVDSTKSYVGIYTETLLSAYKDADRDMVRAVGGLSVVPNKRLKRYLEREVPRRAQAVNIQLNQRPDAQVESEEDVYIATVAGTGQAGAVAAAPASLTHLAAMQLSDVGLRGMVEAAEFPPKDGPVYLAALRKLDAESGFSQAQERIVRQGKDFSYFLEEAHLKKLGNAGFTVSGEKIRRAYLVPDSEPTRIKRTTWENVSIDLQRPAAASAIIVFEDGTSTVLAAIPGYVGNITVARNGVISVSYVPSAENPLHGAYDPDRLAKLHASVATAARFGVFRIESGDGKRTGGASLANSIRMMKGVDPTLGLYAAYAYSEAGIREQVESVRGIMRSDLGVDLFDTAMLAGALKSEADRKRTVPFCPMLSQGWALLRVNKVQLPKEIDAARDHMRPALWTTFDPDGTKLLEDAMRDGRLK